MSENPLISVLMITYNHEKFIAQAIKSVLIQQVNFKYEIVIGEDCSTDRTKDIVVDYQEKYSDRIKLLLQEKNAGMHKNFIDAYYSCRGKYIALLEGDDYWTDPHKLQKQVEFLEANPEYVICFHRVKVLENNRFVEDDITEQRYNNIITFPVNLNNLLTLGNFIHTPSVVFRNIIKEYPWEYLLSPVGDYFLYIILAKNGYIKRLEDVMAVYRKGVGVLSSLNNSEMTNKILIYQSCILSYLEEKHQKQILLDKHINLIKGQFENNHHIGFRNLLKTVIVKIVNIICKKRM
jgi:glycosyltransferase involved in cell wall biosynthesis